MKDRIQINGEWYIKESSNLLPEPEPLDLTYTQGCVYETSKYCFEATRLYKDYDSCEFYEDTLDIEFTDKRTKPWKTDDWDRVDWFRGVYDNDKRAINEALKVMDEDGVKELKQFIGHLIKIGWLKYYDETYTNENYNK